MTPSCPTRRSSALVLRGSLDPGTGPGGRAVFSAVIARLLILLCRAWQLGPSAILPPTCRYQPSCSAYAIEALRRYGALKGGWLAARRIARCHPWGGRSEEHTSELQSLLRISYAVFCLKKKKNHGQSETERMT